MANRADGRVLPEWAQHDACWLAYPHLEAEWGAAFEGARADIAALCRAIATHGGERVELLVRDAGTEAHARAAVGPLDRGEVRFHRPPYGDCWTRDTAPLFALRESRIEARCFRFNGWGGRYEMPGDTEVAGFIAGHAQRGGATGMAAHAIRRFDFVLEGGAIEVDGEGTVLTTEQCLLNPNRGAPASREAVEARLREALGVERVCWLRQGLRNDHTDGHVDTIARFVGPGVVACMAPADGDDPNAATLDAIAADLASMRDAAGRRLEVHRIPSPGLVLDAQGAPLPASYANFYVANDAVVVPAYGVPADAEAVRALARLFPSRAVVPSPARALISGGGALHCATMQQPAAPRGDAEHAEAGAGSAAVAERRRR